MDFLQLNSSLNFTIITVLFLLLVWKAGKTFPLLYLFIFIYYLQYIFSPYLIYNNYKVLRDQMPVDQDEYFSYATPALLCLFAGVLIVRQNFNIRLALQRIHPGRATELGFLLVSISYFFDIVNLIGLPFLASIISFTTYLKYLAAFCFLFSNSKFRYYIIGMVYLQLAFSVLREGVFVSFFIWSLFLFFFIVLRFRINFFWRAALVILAFPVIILVQSVKKEYRQITWQGRQEGGIQLFRQLAEKNQEATVDQPFEKTTGVVRTIGRLNQGWHVGLVLRHVPAKEPFANGQEFLNDIFSSILPRAIFSDKKTVNSQEKFTKYTGHVLTGHTSMSIGLLGDFYINFGREWSFVMLFLFGAITAKFVQFFVRRYVLPDPINIVWIPFMLSYLIRANNDFYIFFNCLIKGFVIFIVIRYIQRQYFGRAKRRSSVVLRPVNS